MTYSNAPGGYGGPPQGPSTGGYGPQPQGYGAAPAPGPGKGLPFYLNIGVIALGVISFFLGFLPFSKITTSGIDIELPNASSNFFMTNGLVSTALLLAAALVVAFGVMPKQEVHDGIVASLSVVAFVALLFQMVTLPSGTSIGIGLILVLITSFLQAAVAVAALLFAAGIIKPPAPKPPQYGYYGQGPYTGPQQQPLQQAQPQQPYYGGAPAQYQQSPPSQPPQPHNQW